jgi:DNA-binding transcriptional MerR regulator
MRIGELARRAGVSVRSLRYYEEQGLLVSTRSASGQRHYAEEDVARVVFLQRMYAAGLSSRTIYQVLPCTDDPGEATADSAYDLLVTERAKLDAHITELLKTRDTLDSFIAANRRHRAALDREASAATA